MSAPISFISLAAKFLIKPPSRRRRVSILSGVKIDGTEELALIASER